MKTLPVTLRRLFRRVAVVASLVAVSALVVSIAALAYLRTASGRGLLAAKLSAWVSRELVAELRIERIEVLANDRLVISGATLFDTKGRAVVRVRGVSARLDLFTLLANVVVDSTVRVELSEVHVERAEIGLYRTETGGVSLSQALEIRRVPDQVPNASKAPAEVSVHLPRIAIDCLSARTDSSGLTQATAELHALTLSFAWSPKLLSFGFGSDDVRVLRASPLDAKARLHGQIRVPGATTATLDGSLGALPIQATLRVTGEDLVLSASAQSLTPDAMRALVPGWFVHEPLSARVALSGPLRAMQVEVEAQAGASRLNASGTLALSPKLQGELSVAGRELDARLVAPELARTALGVDAKLRFSFDPAIHVDLSAGWAKGELYGTPLPAASIHAVYAANRIDGTLTSMEPALPISADFTVSPQGALGFHARAQNLDLAALSPYGLSALGQADLDASGELSEGKLAAQFEARIGGLHVAPVRTQTALVRGKLQGAVARPEQLGVEVQAHGSQLVLGGVALPAWSLESKGSLERQLLAASAGPKSKPTLQASTTLTLQQGVLLGETRLAAQLNGVKHALAVKSARFADRVIDVRGLEWQIGTGSLVGSALISEARKQADLELRGLEAEAVLKTLGVDSSAFRGRVAASFHFQEDGRARHGSLKASLNDGALPALGAVHAELDASLAGTELEGQGSLVAAQLGQAKLSARGTLAKEPIRLHSLSKVLGELRLDIGDVELAEVRRRWFPGAPVALSGTVEGSVRLAKQETRTPATVSYELKTRDLGLRSDRSDEEGVLGHAELVSHGQIGATETKLEVELKDAAGTWISAQAEQRIGWTDLVRLLDSPSPSPLLDAPLQAVISTRPRSLELLGAVLPRAFRGDLAANFRVTGTARRPEIEGAVSATRLGTADPDPSGKLALTFGYSAEREQYSFAAHYAERKRAKLEFTGGGHWGWFDRGFGRAWSTRGEGRIEQIQIGPLAELLGVRLSGVAAGQAAIRASASEFEATGEVALSGLALDRQPLGRGTARLRVHQGLAEAQLSLAGKDATLDLSGEIGLCWKGGPCIDTQRGGSVDAKVRNYQLASLAPLLRSVASDVRGPVNGFFTLGWGPTDAAGKRKTQLRADALVTGGSVTLAAGAGSIQCVELRARDQGEETLQLELTGCGRSKKPNLWATVDVRWNGPLPERIDAELYADHFPVSHEGVVLGTATVDKKKTRPIQLKLDLSGTKRAVEASIPGLDFELPTKDDTSLVDLTEDASIHVTDEKTPPALAAGADKGDPWSVSVRLGHAVNVKQPGLRVPLTGSVTQSPDGLLDGSIVFPEGGVVSQLGQVFRLKRGSVRFDHQAVKDGVLNVEAATRTADGVVVDLYVSGTIEKPVIRLRSDPPRSESDIVALLLGLQSSNTVSSSGQQGADLRGSATALAMNQLLRGSALAGLQFGAGQTHAGDSVSTVSMRSWWDSVWFEGRTVRSTTQRAANSGVQSSGVIDWRFARGFSLRTQLGNISGLELRWSHRY
ncbi:MAG TPA: translocation/assembly module TamB domain-containing protein [Polyangiaceae bacterium]|nr:translocation/assembly module TamB domain-containing protein [Polyangiaceae bacterium]